MMPRVLLGPRRLRWFLTYRRTKITFTATCRCGVEYITEGRWFIVTRTVHDSPWCNVSREVRHEFSSMCLYCWLRIWYRWKYYVTCRWRFRLKYNWGIGVDPRCASGHHDWPEMKEAYIFYTMDGKEYYTAKCRRCGFTHRWEMAS